MSFNFQYITSMFDFIGKLCLTTGLRFADYFHPTSSSMQFRERVFLFLPPSRSVRLDDVMHVFINLLHQLDDAGTMKVSLLCILDHIFFGKYPRQPITEEILALVSNLEELKRYILTYIIANDAYTN